MDEEIIIFEQECGEPEEWETNVVYIRDENGNLVEFIPPDDIEEDEEKC